MTYVRTKTGWLQNSPITQKLIFHFDHGVQYACEVFTNILINNVLVERSISRKGNYWNKSLAEGFFKTIRIEGIYNFEYANHREATLSIFDWIESWYNRNRRHSALGYKTIEEFEKINSNFNHSA